MRTLLLILAFTLPASAQIASYIGPAPAGVTNTPVVSTSGPMLPCSSSVIIAGASCVTYQQGAAKPATTTTYTTTITGNYAGATGSITVGCDDYCTVKLNGTAVGTTTPAQWNSTQTFPIPAAAFVNGVNTLTFTVTNTTGNTGLIFKATVTPSAAVTYKVNCLTEAFSMPAPASLTASCTLVKTQ